jgi:signal transduction histidine kinase
MQYNNMFMLLPVTTTIIVISTLLSMAILTNVSVFAQSEGTNQTGESLKQKTSDIVSNVSKEVKSKGSNITKEVAKDVAANIGKQLQDLAK